MTSLSVEQYRTLLRLQARVMARNWLASHKVEDDGSNVAARLSFTKWLYITGRLNEGLPREQVTV